MKKNHFLFAFAALFAFGAPVAIAQSVVSDPLGFNTIVCLPNSDTIVGVPFRPNGSQQGTLAAAPTGTDGDTATLTLSGNPGFTDDEFKDTHYVKFTSGAMDGHWYAITANTSDTLTVDLNGNNVPGAAADDGVVIAKFWTLDTLFPPADATTDPATTGHAIVKSSNVLNRSTEVLLPDFASQGINLPPNRKFFIEGDPAAWKEVTTGFPAAGSVILWPDTYFIIRNPGLNGNSTKFKISGEVETGKMAIPLSTSATGMQDNFVAIPRAIDVKLTDLGLISSGAFVPSSNTLNRADELFVYDNSVDLQNRTPSAKYFYYDGAWRKVAAGFPVADDDVIPAGSGILIRKAQSDGSTVFWVNYPNY